MNQKRLHWAAWFACIACGALLYPYFRATLQLFGFSYAHAWGIAGAALAAVSSWILLRLTLARLARSMRWGMPLAFLLMISTQDFTVSPGGMGATLGVVIVQSLVLALFVSALLDKLAHAMYRVRAGILVSGSTFWFGIAVGLAIALSFVTWLSLSRFVWYWDYSGYAGYTANLVMQIKGHGVLAALSSVKSSLSDEYNLLPALPLAVAEVILGANRVDLVLAISVLYVTPVVLTMAYLLHRATGRRLGGKIAILVTMLSMLVFPVTFFAALYGMPDVGGVFIIAAIAASLYREGGEAKSENDHVSTILLCAGLVFLLCVFRRWYCFIAVPLIMILAIREWFAVQVRAVDSGAFVQWFQEALIFAAYLGLCGLAFYWTRFLLTLKANYTEAYQAYWGGRAAEIGNAIGYIGFGPALLVLASLMLLVIRKSTRATAIGIPATLFVTVYLFLHVQGFGPHHYLLLTPLLAFAVALAIASIFLRYPKGGWFAVAFLFVVAVGASSGVVTPHSHDILHRAHLLPVVDMRPPERHDLVELNRLSHDLAMAAEKGHTVCVVASGAVLNGSIMAEVARDTRDAYQTPLLSKMIWLGDVDRRDGPASGFPGCDRAVITDPPETHLSPGEQQVIVYLAKALKSDTGIGASFRSTGQIYQLDRGVRAEIYERISPIKSDDWQKYIDAVTRK